VAVIAVSSRENKEWGDTTDWFLRARGLRAKKPICCVTPVVFYKSRSARVLVMMWGGEM